MIERAGPIEHIFDGKITEIVRFGFSIREF